MIKNITSDVFNDVANFYGAENHLIRGQWDQAYNMPLQQEMNQAMDVAVQRTAELMAQYARREPSAKHAVEQFAIGNIPLNDPPDYLTPSRDRAAARFVRDTIAKVQANGRLPRHVAAEFIHTVSDLPSLTLACVTRQMARLSEQNICNDACLDDIFFTTPARDICEERGRFGLVPQKAPINSGQPEVLDGDCDIRYWRFTDIARGDYHMGLYRDSIKWSWLLGQCSKYGGWTDELVSWILRIQQERRIAQRASLLGDENGINTSIFNAENNNIIISPDGATPNPAVTCAADAYYVLESLMKQWSQHRDKDGQLACQRPLKIVTGDWDVHCAFTKALTAEVTEKMRVNNDVGECIAELDATGPGCFQDIEACYSKELREQMGDAAMGAFFMLPVAAAGEKNAFEEASLMGFENTQLARKVPQWQTLGGSLLTRLGSDHCFNQEVMAVIGYGMGAVYPELAFASDGTEA